MINKIQIVVLSLLIISVVCLSTGLYYSIQKTGQLTEKIENYDNVFQEQQKTIAEMKNNVQNMKQSQTRIEEKNTEIENNLRTVNTRLDKSIGKENVVAKHPKMIENMLNKNYSQFAKEFSCQTGAKEQCVK